MARSVIKQNNVKTVTVTKQTDSDGNVFGGTTTIFGIANSIILSVYFERGEYAALRHTDIRYYGSAGYILTFYSANNIVSNSDVTFTVAYIKL